MSEIETPQQPAKPAPSIEFENAFSSGSGGCVRDCICGIVHFDYYNSWDWEDEELEALQEKAAKDPEKYIGHNYSISTYIVSGREIVMGCPCNFGGPYEEFILEHAAQIAAYLNSRSETLSRQAQAMVVRLPQ